MDVMNMLEGDALEGLRAEFLKHGEEGIQLEDYVRVMMEKLLESEKLPVELRNPKKLVPSLCDMFNEIDRNGNGRVEWGEFTGYCVDAGFVATRRFIEPLRFRYVEDIRYKDTTSRGAKINRLIYLPQIQRIASLEKESMVLKLYDHKLRVAALLDIQKAAVQNRMNMEHRRKDQIVFCMVIPKKNTLVVLSSDLSITFWDATTLRFNYYAFSKALQRCAAYSHRTGKLYTGGSDGKIQVWAPEKGNREDFIATKHTEQITDLCVVETHDLLVSCSLDKTIQLFDLSTHEWKANILGHTRGCRQLRFSEQQNMLLSVGVECDAFGWDLTSRMRVVTFQGHRSALVGLEILPVTAVNKLERAVTVDDLGNFRVWDFQRSHTGNAVCLQVFQRKPRSLHGKAREKFKNQLLKNVKWNLNDFHPNTFCIVHQSGEILAASSKIHRFTTSQCLNMDNLPNSALFNKTSLSFITITGHDVQIWNAADGTVQEDMFGIGNSELTTLLLDDRERKFVVGTADGSVNVHSFLNGVRMKESESPHEADVTGIAYVGREKIIISVARDMTVRVHDDWPEEETAPFLRSIEAAHQTDITCVDYSDAYSLIATGSADGTVHLWNFEFLKLEIVLSGHSADLVAVNFVGAIPLLVSADISGVILFSMIGPGATQGKCLFRWENWNNLDEYGTHIYRSKTTSKITDMRTPISCMAVHKVQMGEESEKWLLALGDELGVVKVLDMTKLLKQFDLREREPSRFPHNRTGYNARRRIKRDFSFAMGTSDDHQQMLQRRKSSSRLLKPENQNEALLTTLSVIKAHSGAVNTIQIIGAPLSVLTSSMDRSVRVHSVLGSEFLGILNMSDEEREAITNGEKDPHEWKFNVKPAMNILEQEKASQANSVFESLEQVRKKEESQQQDAAQNPATDNMEDDQVRESKVRKLKLEKARKKMQTAIFLMKKLHPEEEAKRAAAAERSLIKSQLLEQLASTDTTSTTLSAQKSKKSYENFEAEHSRHHFVAGSCKVVDLEPSDFLRKQLRFGKNKYLKEKKRKQVENLAKFHRRFAPKGFLEGSTMRQQKLAPIIGSSHIKSRRSNQEEELDHEQQRTAEKEQLLGVPRPSTAPTSQFLTGGGTSMPSVWEQWEASNQSFLNDVSSLLDAHTPKLNTTLSLPSLHRNEEKRPSTAGPVSPTKQKKADWRRRSSVVLERVERIISLDDSDEEDSQDEDSSDNDSDQDSNFWNQASSRRKSREELESSDAIEGQPSTAKLPVPGQRRSTIKGARRRTSLVQRQTMLAAQVRKQMQNRRLSSTTRRASLARSSISSSQQTSRRADFDETVGATVRGVRDGKYGKRFGAYPDYQVRNLYQLFKQFDPDESGYIDMQEFYTSPEFRNSPLATSLGSIFETLDEDGDNAIDFPEFLRAFCPLADASDLKNMHEYILQLRVAEKESAEETKMRGELDQGALSEITELFNLLDKDGGGTVSVSELSHIAKEHGFISPEDIEQIVQKYATEDELTRDDFIELCREYFSYRSDNLIREVLSYNSKSRIHKNKR